MENAADILDEYNRAGYLVVRGLFSAAEATHYKRHFLRLRGAGSYPDDFDGGSDHPDDPLKQTPSMVNMHHWDPLSRDWLLDERLWQYLTLLLGAEPYAVQTLLHFKPPGARGQALHQDQYWLRAQPGTCMGAWLSLEQADEENGCLLVVPGSHTLPLLCTVEADVSKSFSQVTVPLPGDMRPVLLPMLPGDVLFFGGHLIHGSHPNRSASRFRCALIGHYISGEARKVASWYNPVLTRRGDPLTLETSEWGGPCGIWVERDGAATAVDMSGFEKGVRY